MFNKGFFYALMTAIMFATMGILTDFVYRYHFMNADLLLFSSLFIGSVFLLILFCYNNKKNFSFNLLKINKRDLMIASITGGLFGLFLGNLAVLKSLQYVNVNVQKIITNSNPLFIVLINWIIFKDKLTKNSIINVILIVLGLFLVIGKMDFSGANIITGIVLAILSSLFIAIYSVLSERKTTNIDHIKYWFYAFLCACLLTIFYIGFSSEITQIKYLFTNDLKLIFLLFSVSIINFVLPYLTFNKAIINMGAEKTGIVLAITPVITIILSILILNETPTILQFIGALLIITASLLSCKK